MAKKKLLVLALALFSVGASAMFWPFKKYDVEMSPEISGVIKLNGVPQAGLTVYRELFYEGYKKGKILKDDTQTNELGEFSFSSMTIRSRMPGDIFGGSLKVHQKVYLEWQDEQKKIWGAWTPTQGGKTFHSMLSAVDCELSNIQRIHEVDVVSEKGLSNSVSVYSICDWYGGRITTYLYDVNSDTYIAKKELAE